MFRESLFYGVLSWRSNVNQIFFIYRNNEIDSAIHFLKTVESPLQIAEVPQTIEELGGKFKAWRVGHLAEKPYTNQLYLKIDFRLF